MTAHSGKFPATTALAILAFLPVALAAYAQDVPPGAAADSAAADTTTFTMIEIPATMTSGDVLNSMAPPEQKIITLRAMSAQDPRNAAIYNDLGVVYAELEQWVPARDAFISSVQADPTAPDVHRNLGLACSNLDQADMAVSEFRAYQRLAADGGIDAYRLIAQALQRVGRFDEAETVLREGLQKLDAFFETENARLLTGLIAILDRSDRQDDVGRLLEKDLDRIRDLERRARDGGDAEAVSLTGALVTRLAVKYARDAEIMAESGLHAEAAQTYEKAYALDQRRGGELLPRIVESWLAAGEPGKAKMASGLAARDFPDDPGVWQAKGRIAEQEGRLREAVAAYEKAAELAPGSVQIYARVGSLYLRLGENEKARRFMAKAVSDPETPPEMVFNYALSLIRDDKHSLAVAPLQRVVRERPEMESAWRALAGSLRQIKHYSQAVEAYRRVLEFGDDPRIFLQLGYCLGKLDRHDEAVEAYGRAVELDPAYEKAHYNLAVTLVSAGRWEEALEALTAYREMEPDSYRVFFNTGVCLYNLGRYDEAVDAYDQAISLQPTAAAWNNLGLVYDKLGDKGEARRCYKEAKKIKEGR